eukprot:Phypoly_transcript_11487.p1 GENE.Phypoly_transcript_11487~~Phypoly_transcript_11487.p1  ORF type:complete len:361 (+),score=62.25 Phypoly_transcript_11487:73-1155(+)
MADDNYWLLSVGGKKVNLEPLHPQKFACDDPKALEYLNEHGYVVFKDVATKEEVEELTNLFWENMSIESEGRIKREDMSTWQNYAWQGYVKAGIMGNYGLPHSKFMWRARALPSVHRLFQTIWENDDLLVSFDGCGTFRPPEYEDRWKTQRGWFHVDQNGYVKQGKQAVQGLLNLMPNGPDDGGLVVIPKSVHAFEKIFKSHKNLCDYYGPDYAELNGNHIKELWESDLQPVKICLDQGDFACWDSRTVHCNHPAQVLPLKEGAYLRRLVAYICMTPTSSVTKKVLEKIVDNRATMFNGGYGGSHWPHEMHDTSSGDYTFASGNTPALTMHQWQLVVGKEHASKIAPPQKGNEEPAAKAE